MKVRVDWEALRNELEVPLGKMFDGYQPTISRDTLHLVANDLSSAIRGNRLPFESKHLPAASLPMVNAIAEGASLAIKSMRAG